MMTIFFFNDTATTEIYTLSLHDALPISLDTVPAYALSMAEPTPPFGKLNRWWHDRGLPEILAAYLDSIHPDSSSTSFPWSTGSRSWGTPPASRGSTFGRSIFPGWAAQASPFEPNASPGFWNPEPRSAAATEAFGLSGPRRPVDGSRPAPRRGMG